jgi:Leucine-rich repeat (LRR) protein
MRKILILWFFTFCNLTSAQIIDFPDANFKNALVNSKCVDTDNDWNEDSDVDLNNDGEIDLDEAMKVTNLDVARNQISNLEGIGNFRNLKTLNCSDNSLLSLNVSELKNLEKFFFVLIINLKALM